MPSAMIINDDNFDVIFKILMIGNSSVGKSSIVKRFTEQGFQPVNACASLGIDLEVVTVQRRSKKLRLQVWDTAGQERFRALSTSFYRMAMGFLVVYDITSESSFLSVNNWLTHIKTHAGSDVAVILVGNKSDLCRDRAVPETRGRKLAEDMGLSFFETSAKTGDNVHSAFENMMDLLLDNTEPRRDSDFLKDMEESVTLGTNDNKIISVLDKGKCNCS